MVEAVKMAVEDFGGKVNGHPIEVLSADYQNKVDVTASTARHWLDSDNVSMIIESTDSASMLALWQLGAEKKRIIIGNGSGTTVVTNDACMPYGIHYTWDTYALATGTGGAIVKEGGKSWFFIAADYVFGKSLQADTTRVVLADGGTVVGGVAAPLSTTDFSSYLLQAQASKAQVIGLANAGGDFVNSVKQAAEFGISKTQRLAAMLVFINDIKSLGLQIGPGTDLHRRLVLGPRRFQPRLCRQVLRKAPGGALDGAGWRLLRNHALPESRAGRRLNRFRQGRAMDERTTTSTTSSPRTGTIRADGRMVHDMFLAQAKTPAESKGEWDLEKIRPHHTLATKPINRSPNPPASWSRKADRSRPHGHLPQFLVQVRAGDPQPFRHLLLVAAVALQRLADQRVFHVVHRLTNSGGLPRVHRRRVPQTSPPQLRSNSRKSSTVSSVSIGEDHRPLDLVVQLPHIARPGQAL